MALYFALFFGIFLEGEIVYLSTAIAAHRGHFNLQEIIIIGFVATVFADVSFYGLGKAVGEGFFRKRKKLSMKIDKASGMIKKNERTMLLTYRFIFGFKTVIPILLGVQGYSFKRFLGYSLIGTLLFVVVLTSLGLLFGHAITVFLDHIKEVEFYVIGILAVAGIIYKIRKTRVRHSLERIENTEVES